MRIKWADGLRLRSTDSSCQTLLVYINTFFLTIYLKRMSLPPPQGSEHSLNPDMVHTKCPEAGMVSGMSPPSPTSLLSALPCPRDPLFVRHSTCAPLRVAGMMLGRCSTSAPGTPFAADVSRSSRALASVLNAE